MQFVPMVQPVGAANGADSSLGKKTQDRRKGWWDAWRWSDRRNSGRHRWSAGDRTPPGMGPV